MVPTTGKSGKVRGHFPVRQKSGNFEQTGKVVEFYTKYWKCLAIYYFFGDLNFRQFLFLSVNFNLAVLKNRPKNHGKVEEICESNDVGTMVGHCIPTQVVTIVKVNCTCTHFNVM